MLSCDRMSIDRKTLVVINVGFVFFFTFTGFRTLENIEKVLLNFAQQENSDFKGDGFTSLGIVFLVYALSMLFVPSVISLLGLKGTLVLSTFTYIIFLTSFLTYSTWYIYATSVIAGIGLALTWCSGGTIVNLCSDNNTIIRNVGIFYLMYSASLLGGNAFQYFQSQGLSSMNYQTRMILILVLIAVSCVGILAACFLRVPKTVFSKSETTSPIKVILAVFDLMKRREKQLMCVTYFYAGLITSFGTGVYSSSVGSTAAFKSSTSLIGLSGVFIGIGGILGCLCFTIFGISITNWNRTTRILGYTAIQAIPIVLTLLNLPNDSPQGETNEEAIIPSSAVLAIAVSGVLGVSVSVINNQCYDAIEFMFDDNHAGANAIFNFFLSVGSSSSFFYSSYVGLYIQLGILMVLLVASALRFWSAYCGIVLRSTVSERAAKWRAARSDGPEPAVRNPRMYIDETRG